ncbi:Superoxide dismutase protein [Dioscorea alata]|uniref:Superoxide dismutase protein n=1 Tax=Dioscorea alata TaxID=55571 RepID=A0ACB7US74_DIOAL|nr:Superoxide dismutase protein [Dioscorea alata]
MGFPLALPSSRHPPPLASHGLRSSSIDSPKLVLRKRCLCQSRRSLKVVAYYGLTTPPYEFDALEPYMSKRTLEVHWGKHHREYVEGLNKQLANSPVLYGYTLEELIRATYNNGNPLPEFNNAAQVWNHDFFWESMQPGGGKMPSGGLLEQIVKDFVNPEEKKLSIVRTSNAVCPLVWRDFPIIGLDVWEHAYYLDYKDDREDYVNTFMNHLVSWHAATARILRAQAFVNLGEPKIPVA